MIYSQTSAQEDSRPAPSPVLCPVCRTDNRDQAPLSYSQGEWHLKRCRQCRMVYLENPPAHEALEAELAWEKTFAQETALRRKRSPVLHAAGRAPKAVVQRLTKRNKLLHLVTRYFAPGPILDVGCAGGHTLAALPGQYIPFGIEISHELSQIAAEAFSPRGGQVLQADARSGLETLPRGQFTGIVMTSFLEHDSNARETLLAARRVLRNGARLIVKVPNFASWNRSLRGPRWCGFRFPDHVNYFTPETLKRLLSETGFHIARFGLLDRLPTSDTMWLVAETAQL